MLQSRICATVALCGLWMLAAGCGGDAEPVAAAPPAAPVSVGIAAVSGIEEPIAIEATGSFKPDESSDVAPDVSGRVVATPVDVGQFVKRGQILIRIQGVNAGLKLDETRAAVARAEANLKLAESQNNLAQTTAQRYAALLATGDVSKTVADQARTAAETSVQSVNTARASVAEARATGTGRKSRDRCRGRRAVCRLHQRSERLGRRVCAALHPGRHAAQSLNPQYPSLLGGSYVQPLLRGRGIDAERRQILLARNAADLTDAQLQQVVIEQLTLVEQAYWDLVFAARNLDVQTQALAQAQAQVTSNERQAQGGTLAPIDVVEAQTQAANFRQAVASAQQTLTEAENRLKGLMTADRTADVWNQPLVPAELRDRPLPSITLEEAVRLALARRPELVAIETSRAQTEIEQRFFRDQARPQLDLVGSYTLSGLSGDPLASTGNPLGGTDAAFLARINELSVRAGFDPLDPPSSGGSSSVPPFFVGGYRQSLNNVFARRFPSAIVQLQMDLPLRNTTARANVARADLAAGRAARQRQQAETAIEVEVRNTLQAVQSSKDRLDASSSARRNASEQYESERRRFEAGLSTVFLVLERQTALVTAQGQELRARADLNQAIAYLDRAVGGTLERHGVTLAGSSGSTAR